MAAKQQKKIMKKKEREENNRKQKHVRQASLAKKRQEENADLKRERRVKKIQREMGDLSIWGDEVLMRMSDKNLSTLENNCLILRALEDEHRREREAKRELNDQLEKDGLRTLEEKIAALQQKMAEQQKQAAGDLLRHDGLDPVSDELAALNQRINDQLADIGIKSDSRKNLVSKKDTSESWVIRPDESQTEDVQENLG